jgi:hypothetical protein
MGDLVVTVVPVVTQAPMAVRVVQALAAQAAMSPSPTRVPSPPQANALLEFRPRVLAETGTVVPAVPAVLRRPPAVGMAAQVVPAAIVRLLLLAPPKAERAVLGAVAQAATVVMLTEALPLRLPLLQAATGATVVPVAPVVPQAPMAVRVGQALAAQAAMSPSPIRVPLPPQANALLEFLPRVLAETVTVAPVVPAVLQRLPAVGMAAQVVPVATVALLLLAPP